MGRQTVTVLGALLLDVLRADGGWLTRRQLATALGRGGGRMTPYDAQLIEGLVSAGLVEREERPMGIVRTVRYYRALEVAPQ